ncbi:MAG TPA: phage integrase SAM-like domain-containing protein [Vicinamibacterales bacterium]|nr:phage integrase SAM-like domain-containing protein [Vicinamibacterales bacterium]
MRKRCGCPRRNWPKCRHPWHLNFKWRGVHYRLSLDREIGRRLEGKTDARTEAERLRGAIRAGTFPLREASEDARAESLTLETFGQKFLERYSQARGKRTWRDDEHMLDVICRFEQLGEKPLGSVTGDDAERLLQHLKNSGRAGSTYNHYRQILLNMFRWATRKGYLARNPLEHAELPRLPQAKRSGDSRTTRKRGCSPRPRVRGFIGSSSARSKPAVASASY